MSPISCFKAYDIRGRIDDQVTVDLAYRLGRATATVMDARLIVVGRDARATSPHLLAAMADGIIAAGANVIDQGLCGTEEVYFGTDHHNACAGVMVTASHNPIDYNGFKLVGRGAAPLSDIVFRRIEAATVTTQPPPARAKGRYRQMSCRDTYVARVLSFIDPGALRPLRILVNAGNGAAGPTCDAITDALSAQSASLDIIRLHHHPDPTFPNGIPNPLLAENQPVTASAAQDAKVDFAVAWDGDFDRCFFFDDSGQFIPGEYMVGLLAGALLTSQPGATIVHDPRVIWNTRDMVDRMGGQSVLSPTGHALVKARMRQTNAIYGGEISAHHYFRDFMFCDSGMIPWLLVAAQLSDGQQTLGQQIAQMRQRFASSGELNFTVQDPAAVIRRVQTTLQGAAIDIDHLDGLSLTFPDWRLNLRRSNTEPLLRLNIETRGDHDLLQDKLAQVTALIGAGA